MIVTGLAVLASSAVVSFDASVVSRAVSTDLGPVTDGAHQATALANSDVVFGVALAAILLLALLRHWRGAFTLALSLLATQLVVALIKGLVERPRPVQEGLVEHASNFSFPSGHAATAVAVYAVLALAVAGAMKGAHVSWRVAVIAVGVLVVLAVGGSRVMLGVHYPTDVLAGWTVGAGIALTAWWLTERLGAVAGRVLQPAG
jgi:undecaprenyl-diphosphatase